MFALDTNILVYAHNLDSPRYEQAAGFVERVVRQRGERNGHHIVGIPLQVCVEFTNVITRNTIEQPLSLSEAIEVIRDYVDIVATPIIVPQPTQLRTFPACWNKPRRAKRCSTLRSPRRSKTITWRGFTRSMLTTSRASTFCK